MLSQSLRKLSWALLAETPFLLVTLGLLAWALHILSHSITITSLGEGYDFAADQTYLWTLTQTVTGYRTSSSAPPSVETYRGSTYSEIGLNSRTTPYTNTPYVYTLLPETFGIDPTATEVRTVTVSGIEPISHLEIGDKDDNEVVPSPTITPAPSLSLQPRQVSSKSSSSDTAFWTIPSTANPYQKFESVTVNRGFDGYFLEVGIDYVYKTQSTSNDLPRIRALTALISLALISILGRLACTIAFLISDRKSKRSGKLISTINEQGRINIYSINRKLIIWLNISFTILLLLTYIPFWSIYASWTYRSAAVSKADAEFQSDLTLVSLDLSTLLKTIPWNDPTTALIVFWTLTVVASILISMSFLLMGRDRMKKVDIVV